MTIEVGGQRFVAEAHCRGLLVTRGEAVFASDVGIWVLEPGARLAKQDVRDLGVRLVRATRRERAVLAQAGHRL